MDSLSYCFKWTVLNNGQLEFTFIFQKVSSLASSENEMSLNPSHHYQISFPALSEYGISNVIPRFIGIRSIKFHSPVGRMTRRRSISFSSVIPRFVGWRNVKNVIPSVSGPEMSPIKMSVSTNHQFTNTFQISQYNYQHSSEQSLFPSETTVSPSEVGSLSSTNLGIPFLSKQIIFVILHS